LAFAAICEKPSLDHAELGKECMETERAIRVVEDVRNLRIGTCSEASKALLQEWEAPVRTPVKRRTS
jgi:hypothetical protein